MPYPKLNQFPYLRTLKKILLDMCLVWLDGLTGISGTSLTHEVTADFSNKSVENHEG